MEHVLYVLFALQEIMCEALMSYDSIKKNLFKITIMVITLTVHTVASILIFRKYVKLPAQ